MPTIDLVGYTCVERDALIKKITPVLKRLEFAQHIVFVTQPNQDSVVLDLEGDSKPFVRIYTRTEERAQALMEVLKPYCDIEMIYLAFFQFQSVE